MAQSIGQRFPKPQVAGSNLGVGYIFRHFIRNLFQKFIYFGKIFGTSSAKFFRAFTVINLTNRLVASLNPSIKYVFHVLYKKYIRIYVFFQVSNSTPCYEHLAIRGFFPRKTLFSLLSDPLFVVHPLFGKLFFVQRFVHISIGHSG